MHWLLALRRFRVKAVAADQCGARAGLAFCSGAIASDARNGLGRPNAEAEPKQLATGCRAPEPILEYEGIIARV